MKLTRYDGHVPLFSQNMEGRERTLFGSTVQDDDINNQFTPEFLRGWGSVGSTEFPTLQDFNALAYTHNKLLSYLYQAGIPSYTKNEEYYIGSIVQYNKDIYICLRDNPTVLPTDTNSWKRLQESLTFVGDGPEVMRKGAFGIGYQVVANSNHDILDIQQYNTGFSWFWAISAINRPENRNGYFYVNKTNNLYAVIEYVQDSGRAFKNVLANGVWRGWFYIYDQNNTRTDKNNVLHAGTTTPINTLNVSDMSQEVINNDLLTVTSGAVYRALQQKADLTYVNTELGKKITGGNVVQTTGQSTTDVMSQKATTDAINTKITGGSVVQSTGSSTTNVLSQKAYTDLTLGIDQRWVDVTSQRVAGATYTNNTAKPIFVNVGSGTANMYSSGIEMFVDGASVDLKSITGSEDWADVALRFSVLAFVAPGQTYRVDVKGTTISSWMEYR